MSRQASRTSNGHRARWLTTRKDGYAPAIRRRDRLNHGYAVTGRSTYLPDPAFARSRGTSTRSKEHMRIDALERPDCHRVAHNAPGGPQPDDTIIRKANNN